MDGNRIKACCGFGYREVYENITEQLDKAVLEAAEQGCIIFYTGAMGRFDSLFSSSVRKAKRSYPNIKLICVKPYMTKEINENGEYLYTLYDDIIIPTELADIHPKSAIPKRNRLLVDWSDVVIGYIKRQYGGAYTALKYASSKKKEVIILKV
ncbi:MAG: DUF1273 domain-containing protein [Ruminococcus sp.]|nr:DUF1273 domain-containing protein [Ruminococcus sp.]